MRGLAGHLAAQQYAHADGDQQRQHQGRQRPRDIAGNCKLRRRRHPALENLKVVGVGRCPPFGQVGVNGRQQIGIAATAGGIEQLRGLEQDGGGRQLVPWRLEFTKKAVGCSGVHAARSRKIKPLAERLHRDQFRLYAESGQQVAQVALLHRTFEYCDALVPEVQCRIDGDATVLVNLRPA